MGRLRNISQIAGSAIFPVGAVISFAGISAPSGWLLCNGATISKITYADLFDIIGTTYNVGNEPSNEFRLPDCRQKFILGVAASGTGAVLGNTGGSIDHTHSLPAHYHLMGEGSDLQIAESGEHETSLNHNHASFVSAAGSPHSHTNTLITTASSHTHAHTLTTNIVEPHNHTIDHKHEVSNTEVEQGHTHPINHTHGSVQSANESSHTHSINHNHPAFTSEVNSTLTNQVGDDRLLAYNVDGGYGLNTSASTSQNIVDNSVDSKLVDHTHSIDIPNFSGSSGPSSAHSHEVIIPEIITQSGPSSAHSHEINLPTLVGSSGFNGGHNHLVTGTISSENSHTHTITGSIDNESSHQHVVDVPQFVGGSASTGAHIHESNKFSGRIGLVTGGANGNTAMSSGVQNPPFLALNMIIKV